MRKHLMIAAAAAALVMLAAVSAVASWGSTVRDRTATSRGDSHTVTVIATHVHFTTADVGVTGPSAGDELVFTAQDVNLAGDTVGRLDGYCVFTKITRGSDHFEECMLAHALQGGQITLQGSFDQRATQNNVFAVTGGTGIYSDASGQAILRFSSRFRFDIQLQD